ncbi:MAG: SagB/ThcOx family dehydrogenase [Proteobacteria bacterium]|nr:SagB/ThcOx family dehydrogenase [Pseudomonadota bacterium]
MKPAVLDRVGLPPPRRAGAASLEESLWRRRSVRAFAAASLALDELSQLLFAAQGVNRAGGYRTAPSAGALFPLEVYLVAGAVDGLDPGVYRFRPGRHDLVAVAAGDRRRGLAKAALWQDWIASAPAVLVIAAVVARTERKYKDRALRYVLIEVGHAAENLCLEAVALGLGATVVGAFRDAEVEALLAMAAEEEPFCLVPVGRPAEP